MAIHDFLLVSYAVVAALVTGLIALTGASERRMVAFVFSLWIMAGAILGVDMFVVPLAEKMGFDLQFNRILTILLVVYILVKGFLWPGDYRALSVTGYERLLYLYLGLSTLSLVVHLSDGVSPQELIVKVTGWMTFVVFYLVMKREADAGLVKSVFVATLCMATMSSIAGVVQFFFDPDFLRIGIPRSAFDGKLRSSGVFDAEYAQSYFLIPAIVIALTTLRKSFLRTVLLLLFAVGIALTFHRMSWGIGLLIVGAYFMMNASRKISRIAIAVAACVPVVFVLASLPVFDIGLRFISDRLFADTMTGRVDLYQVAFDRLREVWLFGIGSAKTGVYYMDMLLGGDVGAAQSETGGIHNLFLNMAYFYGIPVVICFICFLVLVFRFFRDKFRHNGRFYFIPTSLIAMFVLANSTNWFYLNMDPALFLGILLGLSIGAYQKEVNVQNIFGAMDAR